jgi:hypothetical protein
MKGFKVPRIFGRHIFDCSIVTKRGKQQSETPANFIVSRTDGEVYSQDFLKCFQVFPLADTKLELDSAENTIRFSYTKQGQPVEFMLKYERAEALYDMIAPAEKKEGGTGGGGGGGGSGTMTPVDFPTLINFACGIPNGQAAFTPFLEAQARKRVMFLSSSTQITDPLLKAIAVEFKMRFPQLEAENWTEAFEVLWFEFVGFAVSLWTQCLRNAIEPHTGPNSFEYFRRLTANIAALIAKGADVFQVDRREFLVAVRKFLDTGDPSAIPSASRGLVNDVTLALGNVRKRWLLQLTDLFEFSQLFAAALAIGQSIIPEAKEVAVIGSQVSSWALALVDHMVRGPRLLDMRNAVENLAVAVLKQTDQLRYSPEFHCTVALWKLSELAKSKD